MDYSPELQEITMLLHRIAEALERLAASKEQELLRG